jgi:acetyl-CoA C-acetyltransferase
MHASTQATIAQSALPSRHPDELCTSEDYLEGPRAFAEKRKPVSKSR